MVKTVVDPSSLVFPVMTLEELEGTLPNGLHDSEVQSIVIDYVARTAELEMSIFVGEVDAPAEKREAYRQASLAIAGLEFLVIEPPDMKYPFQKTGSIRIDACDVAGRLISELLGSLSSNTFVRSLFVVEWNAFIHIAARDAELVWMKDRAIEYR